MVNARYLILNMETSNTGSCIYIQCLSNHDWTTKSRNMPMDLRPNEKLIEGPHSVSALQIRGTQGFKLAIMVAFCHGHDNQHLLFLMLMSYLNKVILHHNGKIWLTEYRSHYCSTTHGKDIEVGFQSQVS